MMMVLRFGWRFYAKALALCLLTVLCVFLWRLCLNQSAQMQRLGAIVTYRGNEWVQAPSYDDMLAVEEKSEAPKGFALWSQNDWQGISDPFTGRNDVLSVIRFKGDPRLILPSAQMLDDADLTGCLIDGQTAISIFGSKNVVGSAVQMGGEEYIIRGVIDSPAKAMFILGRGDDQLPHVSMQGSADKEAFAMRHGLDSGALQNGFYASIQGVLAGLPPFVLLVIVLLVISRIRRSNVEYPARYYPLLVASFALVLLMALYLFVLIPEQYIPSKWSDFTHYQKAAQQIATDFSQFFTMQKLLSDTYIALVLLKSLAGAGAALLLAIVYVQARILVLEVAYIRMYARAQEQGQMEAEEPRDFDDTQAIHVPVVEERQVEA